MRDATENKNKFIKESLDTFIGELKCELQAEIERNKATKAYYLGYLGVDFYPSKNLDKLKDGIRLLEQKRFLSIKDVHSVKYLMELETYFKIPSLDYICFIDYKPYINNRVIKHAQIDLKLDSLKKVDELKEFVVSIRRLNKKHFIQRDFDYEAYQEKVLDFVLKVKPIVEKHKSIHDFFLNLFIFTAGTAFVANKAMSGHYFFSTKKDTINKINDLIKNIKSLPSNNDPVNDITVLPSGSHHE